MKTKLIPMPNSKAFNIRGDFPILQTQNRGKSLIYLDSAASAQKPRQVIAAMSDFYLHEYANIHRGIYALSEQASKLYEAAREDVRHFIHAQHSEEIVFVRSTTEGINLVAQCYGAKHWQAGDEVILTAMEHHSNIVPWYLLKEQKGIILKVVPVNDDGSLDLAAYAKLFSARTKFVAITHVSNVLGTINPIKEIIALAHQHGVPVLVDGAQAAPHLSVNVSDLDCDFYVFSAHKVYGPSGIGILYGKKALLDDMGPYQGGGGMIETVSFDKVTFAKTPHKFEAGTPAIGDVIGLSAALRYVQALGMANIFDHEQALLSLAEKALSTLSGLRIIGTSRPKVGVISFVMEGLHPHDIGTVLDHENVAVRASHHCSMPLMERFQVPATVRASFGVYTDESDIAALIEALQIAKKVLR